MQVDQATVSVDSSSIAKSNSPCTLAFPSAIFALSRVGLRRSSTVRSPDYDMNIVSKRCNRYYKVYTGLEGGELMSGTPMSVSTPDALESRPSIK